jgi:TP901 family phage tail tape measure protein
MPILSSMIVKLGLDAQGLEQGLQKTSRAINKELASVNRTIGGFTRVGGIFKNLGSQVTVGLTLPIVGAGVALTKFSTDLNASMANVATLIPGATDRVQELKGVVQELAVETGKSTGDMAAGLFQVISAFEDSSDTAKILEINARAATAGISTTTDAINLTSAVTKGYGDVSADTVQKAADLAFITAKLGQTTFPELAASIGTVVPVAAKMAVSQEELFAGFATLTGVTGNTSQVSTQLAAVLRAMIKPTKEMSKAVASLGFSSAEAMTEQLGLVGSLKAIIGTTDGSTEAVGKLFGRAEALNAIFALTGSQSDTFSRKLDAMKDSIGATDTAFREQTEGINKVGFTMKQVRAELQVTAERFGDALAPALATALEEAQPLISGLADLAKWFSELPSGIQTSVVAFAAAVAAIGPLLFISGQLITSIGAIAAAYKAMTAIQIVGHLKAVAVAGTQANAAMVLLGKAVGVVAAAYAGFKLAEWLRQFTSENIRAEKEVQKLVDVLEAEGVVLERGSKSLEEWSKEVFAAVKASKDFGRSLRKQGDEEEALIKQFKALRKEASKYGITIKSGQAITKKLVKELEKEIKAKKGLTKETENTTDAVEEFTQAQLDWMEATRNTEGLINDAERALQDLGNSGESSLGTIIDLASEMQVAVRRATEPVADLDKAMSALSEATLSAADDAGAGFRRMEADLKRLGLKSVDELRTIQAEYQATADRLKGGGDVIAEKTAIFKALEAEAELARRLGQELPAEQRRTLEALGRELGTGLKTNIETPWKDTMTAVSTAITNATQSMVGILIGTEEGSIGDAFKKLGQGVLSSFVEPAIAAIDSLIQKGIKKLLDWLLGDVLDAIGGLGGALRGVLGGGAGAAGGAVGGVGGAAGGAGGGASGAAGGLAGTLSAVGALGSFATGLVGIFQARAHGAFLDKIEQSTRFTAIATIGSGGIVDTLREFLPKLKDIHNAMVNDLLGGGGILAQINDAIRIDTGNAIQRLDDVIRHNLLPTTEDIRALLGGAPTLAVTAPGVGVGITINISGNTFSSQDDIDDLVDAISSRLNESQKL